MWLEDTPADVRRLFDFYRECESIVALEDELLFAAAPEVSGWSAGHHLFHITLANELALRNVRMLVDGGSKWIVHEGGPSLLGLLSVHHGVIPRGVGQAPRAVTPPARPDPTVVRDTYHSNVAELERLTGDLDSIIAARGGIPHADLGVLSATRWLRFAGLHGQHHLRIMREVLEALPARSA
ncbi:DinB family protein [Engelhardtia mirabilis]|uniref:DinB superfamily protein n=1 Tax=Engelhardtia mirabilis TaxID=2528011 RepID=A0A518BLH5_9BACT|nr:DinB superfamily protein [Planctomycetes bacterium Pla133]QDV02152.1 DinB superfamily protein [Planctomycetes bacterium Pla86]